MATAPDGGAQVAGLSPQAQAAVEALKLLRDAYGGGGAGAPGTAGAGGGLGGSSAGGSGSGATAAALAATQLYQRTAATAFHNLDNQLANYLIGLAGSNGVDRTALHRLLRELDVALAELGPTAYTAAGRQRVQAILTAALQRGQQITSGTHATATEIAAAIDQLTLQYLYNINGRDYQASMPASVSGIGPGATAAGQQALSVALAQLGKPYVWGAEGPNSFDCSGLMQYAARSAGANIPRTSQEQYRQLPKVNPADIKPGDLIFPGERFNGGNPTHVLMYLGNGQCVEAPRTGLNVRITKLPSSYAATRWSN